MVVCCRYIRVVGTHNSVNRVFYLVSLEAIYISEPFEVDEKTGLFGELIFSPFYKPSSHSNRCVLIGRCIMSAVLDAR